MVSHASNSKAEWEWSRFRVALSFAAFCNHQTNRQIMQTLSYISLEKANRKNTIEHATPLVPWRHKKKVATSVPVLRNVSSLDDTSNHKLIQMNWMESQSPKSMMRAHDMFNCGIETNPVMARWSNYKNWTHVQCTYIHFNSSSALTHFTDPLPHALSLFCTSPSFWAAKNMINDRYKWYTYIRKWKKQETLKIAHVYHIYAFNFIFVEIHLQWKACNSCPIGSKASACPFWLPTTRIGQMKARMPKGQRFHQFAVCFGFLSFPLSQIDHVTLFPLKTHFPNFSLCLVKCHEKVM